MLFAVCCLHNMTFVVKFAADSCHMVLSFHWPRWGFDVLCALMCMGFFAAILTSIFYPLNEHSVFLVALFTWKLVHKSLSLWYYLVKFEPEDMIIGTDQIRRSEVTRSQLIGSCPEIHFWFWRPLEVIPSSLLAPRPFQWLFRWPLKSL